MDVLCRAIGASLFLSHGIRRDVETNLLLQDSVHVRIYGEYVKRLNPDERSTAAMIKHALKALKESSSDDDVRSTPGIMISRRSLSGVIDSFLAVSATPIVLHEEGEPAESFRFPENPAFILSDHTEFSETDQLTLAEYPRISLGAKALHTSQAITVTHYLLDQLEQDRDTDLVLAHKVWGDPRHSLSFRYLRILTFLSIVSCIILRLCIPWSWMGWPRCASWCIHEIWQERNASSPTISRRQSRSNRRLQRVLSNR